MTEKVLISKTIDNLRFPLTVGVVFIHFYIGNGLNISGITYGVENPDWYYFIVNIVSLVFAQISVPLFFVISGFLFFLGSNDFNSNQYIRKLKKRVKTLLVPYILWNIIAIVWEMKCFIPFLSAYFPPVELKFSVIRIINTFICESNNMGIFIHTGGGLEKNVFPIHVPFWYVRDLILFVVLTPAIYRFIKYGGGYFILLLGLIWFLTPMLFPSGGYLRMFVKGFFFFSFGAYFSINKIRIVPLLQKLNYSPIVYLLLALLDVLTLDHEWHEYVHEIGMWVGVISVTYLFMKLTELNLSMRGFQSLRVVIIFVHIVLFLIQEGVNVQGFRKLL